MLDSATSGMASVMSLTSSRLRASLAMGASPEAAPEAEVQAAEPDFQLTLQSASGSCVLLYPQVSLSAVLCMHPTLCHPLNLETARCHGSSSGVYSMCNNALAARGWLCRLSRACTADTAPDFQQAAVIHWCCTAYQLPWPCLHLNLVILHYRHPFLA